MTHCAVEEKRAPLPRHLARRIEVQPIPTYAHERQSARPPGMFHGLFLSVLSNRRELLVVVDAERPVDSPVVRDRDGLPRLVVGVGRTEGDFVCRAREFPTVFERLRRANLRAQHRRE